MGTTVVYTQETLESQNGLKQQIIAKLLRPEVFVEQVEDGDEGPGDGTKQSMNIRYFEADRVDISEE